MEKVSLEEVDKYINEVFSPDKKLEIITEHKQCDLCNLTERTTWYYQNDDWIICDCKTCHRPMIVYKKHTMFVPIEKWFIIMKVVIDLFGTNITLRFKQRLIKDHYHVHIYLDNKMKGGNE